MLKLVIFTLACYVTAIIAKGCIPEGKGPWGCMRKDKCYSDSLCGVGHKCCPHICGDYCYLVVNCAKLDCHLKCVHGFERDARGCDVCKCRTTERCTDIRCLIG